MATPSSSATSASPPMSYLQPASQTSATSADAHLDPSEREIREKTVQKFIARAEISMVTRALRARLSYASFKATHNISHLPLRDIEVQNLSQQAPSLPRSQSLKRKSSGSAQNYYNNPNTQGDESASSRVVTRRGNMAPPPVASNSTFRSVSDLLANTAIRPQSLYSSLLVPPPAKQARTIHNASDPPLAPPKRPSAVSSRSRGVADSRAARSVSDTSRANAKIKRGEPKAKLAKDRKGKQKERSVSHPVIGSREETDVDMKAAATLTSLLFHSRPGASPRPSNAGSTILPGSPYQYGHGSPRVSTSAPVSAASSFTVALPIHQGSTPSSTPPPFAGASRLDRVSELGGAVTTPKMGSAALRPHETTNDSEAANLMLFLATSPSPAQPTTASDRDAKDSAAFKALSGGNGSLRAKGRVLFPHNDGLTGESDRQPLVRHNDSFNASVSSIGSHLGYAANMDNTNTRSNSPSLTPGQILITPGSPQLRSLSQDSAYPPSPTPWASSIQAPPTPGNPPFNFNDFINVSPSPAAPARNTGGGPLKSSLRADVGRKLFEEEQQRNFKDSPFSGMSFGRTPSFGEELVAEDRSSRGATLGLGAGIDLVQT